jgi:SAM-dependent methyltransferase
MKAPERLSLTDGSLVGGYSQTVQRLQFAAPYCRGRNVLDAGCGAGLGAHYLARHGATKAIGVDVSTEAIDEAQREFAGEAVSFRVGDLQRLDSVFDASERFGAIVSFEVLAHLPEPDAFLGATCKLMEQDGVLVLSTPNREAVMANGPPAYSFYFDPFDPRRFEDLLNRHYGIVQLWGQWLTPAGQLRKQRDFDTFQYLSESYHMPSARLVRGVRRVLGRRTLPPPQYHGAADSYPGDYELAPLAQPPSHWPPTVLLAVCRTG